MMNFYSQYLERLRKRNSLISWIILAIIIAFLIVSGLFALYIIQSKSLEDYIASTNSILQSPTFINSLAAYDALNTNIAKITTTTGELDIGESYLNNGNTVSTKLLDYISSNIPTDVTLESIAVEGVQVDLQGRALKKSDVAVYEHNLLKDSDFISAIYVTVTSRDTGDFKYSMSIALNPLVGGDAE